MNIARHAIEWLRWLKDWMLAWSLTPHAMLALFIIAFAESSFFPLPPDLLLIAMALANPKMALLYAGICLVGSTLGGMFGYFIGIKGGKPILLKFVNEERIKQIHSSFEQYEEWAIGIAGFTPIPYKVFAIAAGVFYIDFWKFVMVTVLSRGARFFLVATLIMIFGEKIKYFLDHNFDKLTLLFTILLIGGFLAMKFIKIPHKEEKHDNQESEKNQDGNKLPTPEPNAVEGE